MKTPVALLAAGSAGGLLALILAAQAQGGAAPVFDHPVEPQPVAEAAGAPPGSLRASAHIDDSPPLRTGPLGGFADVVDQVAPAVVSITSSSLVPVGRDLRTGQIVAREVGGLGSGVIVSTDGLILTNVHVISGEDGRPVDRVTVQLSDLRELEARVVGLDPESDIAVLDVGGEDLPVATLGNSDQLRPGDTVLAIGSPYGLSETVTTGIVSAVGRTNLSINPNASDEEFIQTDASINPGNSGGALADNRGRVIGINTAIFSQNGGNVGIGFAIPISKALDIADQLVSKGRVSRGYLGIAPEEMTPELARAAANEGLDLPASGILVWRVGQDSPAALGGLRSYDVITALDGEEMKSKQLFLRRIAGLDPGSEARFSLVRDGQPLELRITLGERS